MGCSSQRTAATTMGQMTEYERKRLENVQRNQQMLAALRVHDTAEGLRSASKKPKLETKGYKPSKRGKEPEPSVLRRSLRTRGISPESVGDLGSDSPPAKPLKQLIASSPAFPKPPRSARNGPLSLAETYVPFREEASYDHYFNLLRQLRDHAPLADLIRAKTDRGSEGGALVGPKFSPGDLKLEAKDIARLAPNRIFSVHILPCRERVIVASGDKEGHLSLWDADCEEEGNGLHMYLPHSSPVSGIATAPFSVEKVLSCSYDGFIRCMDIEKEVFDMLYTNNMDIMLSAICCPHDGYQSIYFAEGYGEIKVLDLRVRGVSNSYDLHEKRIHTIDFHPYNPHLVSTSSTDCTASIWDVRNMRKRQTKSIATVRHDKAVHSAYFSPSGNYLATTSYDDSVGVSNGLDSWNTTFIYHYNPPRRWISSFRAIWGWDDQYLFIGNMDKALDAICTSTKITTTLHSSFITAIPTRFAKHPFVHGVLAGANAGGRVYLWRKH